MLKIVIIVVAIVVLLVLWLVSSYNGFVRLRNKSEEAFSAMDVSLKKRYDLIPNFVETVKGYAKHEQDTLQAVINARNMAINANSPEQKIANDNALSGTLKSLFALTESYPDLKANQNFLSLQNQLSRIEEELQVQEDTIMVLLINTTRKQRCSQAIFLRHFSASRENLFMK